MPLIIAPYVIAAGGMLRANLLASPLIANCIAEACAGIVILPVVIFNHACNSSNQSLNGTCAAGSHVGGVFRFIILFCSIFGSSVGIRPGPWKVYWVEVQLRYQVESSAVARLCFLAGNKERK